MKTKDKLLGAGIGLTALAAAGAYFFYGKRGEKNRAMVADWALKLKEEVLEKTEHLKEINQSSYDALVDEAAERFGRARRVSASELAHIKSELKNAWTHVASQLKAPAR